MDNFRFLNNSLAKAKIVEEIYICEGCGFRADRLKKHCGKKMIDSKHSIRRASTPCGCSL